jgi:hypothetical protein
MKDRIKMASKKIKLQQAKATADKVTGNADVVTMDKGASSPATAGRVIRMAKRSNTISNVSYIPRMMRMAPEARPGGLCTDIVRLTLEAGAARAQEPAENVDQPTPDVSRRSSRNSFDTDSDDGVLLPGLTQPSTLPKEILTTLDYDVDSDSIFK